MKREQIKNTGIIIRIKKIFTAIMSLLGFMACGGFVYAAVSGMLNVGGIPLYLIRIRTKSRYTSSNRRIKAITKKIPLIGKPIVSFAHYTKQVIKRAVIQNMYFEDIDGYID